MSCDTEDAEGSRGVSGGPAQGCDVGATMGTQCPVEDGERATWPCPVVGAASELPQCSYRSTGSKYRMGLPSPIAISISISLRVLSPT